MSFRVETTKRFEREFRKLDKYTQKIISGWISKHLINCIDPRANGKALTGKYAEFWRYRIGDYRLICLIKDDELIILALSVGHRREVYER